MRMGSFAGSVGGIMPARMKTIINTGIDTLP